MGDVSQELQVKGEVEIARWKRRQKPAIPPRFLFRNGLASLAHKLGFALRNRQDLELCAALFSIHVNVPLRSVDKPRLSTASYLSLQPTWPTEKRPSPCEPANSSAINC